MLAKFTALLSVLVMGTAAQPGGAFVAVGNQYNGAGCTDLLFADPIFGRGNVCQPLDRQGDNGDILSYQTLSVSAGCSVALFTDDDCLSSPVPAPVGQCIDVGAPLISAFVTCV